VTGAVQSSPPPGRVGDRPSRPPPSIFGVGLAVGAVVLTVVSVIATNFSFANVISDLSRPNSSVQGLLDIDWSQVVNERTLAAFVETVQMAVVGTVVGGFSALPLALWNSRVGAPNTAVFWLVKGFNNVVRAIPDVLWALLFVAMVGTGALPGIMALVFFSIAVVSKLTSDVLDGLDLGPVEAAHAVGARHTQMLRTAIVPQVLPAYSSFLLYSVELNLRASAVLGLVGAGGIGTRIEFYRGRGEWSEVWGIIVLFFIVTFVVERISLTFRRRLV
jgi:phosphonate transport system permease protein